MKQIQLRQMPRAVLLTLAASASALFPLNTQANSLITYTTTAQFNAGNPAGVTVTSDQVQLSGVVSLQPFMWIANAGEDTVSKINTTTMVEVARYRTGFGPSGQIGYVSHLGNPWAGPAPSRTAVDAQGNVYVANRHFDNKQSVIVKILATGGIDRNGNGTIETSTGPGDIKNLSDTINTGYVEDGEIQDERIAWFARFGTVAGICRSLSIGPDGHLWAGLYSANTYYKISSVNGSVLAGPISMNSGTNLAGQAVNFTHRPYGSLVDNNGMLWSAGWDSLTFVRMDTTNASYPRALISSSVQTYGIALGTGPTAGHVYHAYAGQPFLDYNIGANTFTNASQGFGAYGISVDSAGFIYTSGSTYGGSVGLTKFRPDRTIVWTKPAQAGGTAGDQRGAIVDSNGDVWTVNKNSHSVSKFRSSDGAALGVVAVGNQPYTYSDASGSAFAQSNPSGTWSVVQDTGCTGATGSTVSWTATVPASGASLVVEVRAANTAASLGSVNFVAVTNGGATPPSVVGRFLEVRATLSGTIGATLITPILHDLTVATPSDSTPPVISCPANIVRNTDAGLCGATVTFAATATDNCIGATTLTYSHPSGSVFPKGTTTVVATARDAVGNTSTCSFTVTVNDLEKPVIASVANIAVNTTPGACTGTASFSTTATDNCSGVTISYSPASGSAFPMGTTTVTATATDSSNNTASTQFTVTVTDIEKPVIASVADLTVNTTPGVCTAPATFATTAQDNCSVVTIAYSIASGSTFAKGATAVTATATDASGNFASTTFTVTVVDAEKPVIASVANIAVNTAPGVCTAPVSFATTATDNCPDVTITYSPASGSAFPKGDTTVTATATDASGNAASTTFTVTVSDKENPVIASVTNVTVNTTPGACTAPASFATTATDNCPGVTIVYSPASGSTFAKGTTTVTATATDAVGNTASTSFTVTVLDKENPVIASVANITVNTTPGACTAPVSYFTNATDNCPGVTIIYSPASGSIFAKGATTVTATAADASGNTASTSFTVTVLDKENPVIASVANITVNTTLGACTAQVSYGTTATDNCPGTMIAYSPASGSVFAKGTTTVTATATDASGNPAVTTFTVTVLDKENPVIACPANITVGNDLGRCDAVVRYVATATDNCPGATITYSIAPGSVFPKGTTTVTATATDAAGNKATCSFTVTVNDTQAPVGTCVPTTNPAGKNEPGAKGNGNNGQNPDGFYQLLGTDNCDAPSALALYVKDSASSYVAGPFKSGDKVKITQSPGGKPNTKPMAGDIVAHIHLNGDALLVVTDVAGNTSVVATCLVPPGPK